MENKTFKGLEAIRLMEQGKIITDGRETWKIKDNEILKSNMRMKDWYDIYKFEMSRGGMKSILSPSH